jgi:hypothetical protein
MPALLLVLVLLLAGCVPGGSRSDGIPTTDAPFSLTALDVGHTTFSFRCRDADTCGSGSRSAQLDGAIIFGNLQVVRPGLESHIALRTADPGN